MPKQPTFTVLYKADRDRVFVPDRIGLWYHNLVGTLCRVNRQYGTGRLYFPAGSYAEQAVFLDDYERTASARRPHWSKAHEIIDIHPDK